MRGLHITRSPLITLTTIIMPRPLLRHLNADTSWLVQIPTSSEDSSATSVFTILIDPWFTGPQTDYSRFLSTQEHAVPSAVSSISELCQKFQTTIDAVCISHEWTDHCHKATLMEVAPDVPVFATTVSCHEESFRIALNERIGGCADHRLVEIFQKYP
jgi:hypothetical protein